MSRKFKFKSNREKPKINLLSLGENAEGSFISPHTQLFSNREITVEGCKGVMEYKDTYLKIKIDKGLIILCGDGFCITHYENHVITVKGKISTIEFCMQR